jgi:hypothetical protein
MPKSFNITRIYMFAILDKAKHNTENIRDFYPVPGGNNTGTWPSRLGESQK